MKPLSEFAYKTNSRFICPQRFNRLFSSPAHIPITHSADHLNIQQKLFKHHNIATSVTALPIGTKLIGLNITPVEPHFLGTAPVYNPGILNALSHREKQEWLEMGKTYYAQVGRYELLCDIHCVTSLSENGVPTHYIDHRLLEVQSYTPVAKMLDISNEITHPMPK
ncbi:MAG TPA: hypothetical protein DDY37_01950 [Legionella sp.]|nr:hypothetical protein [Legionella sp.]